MRAGMVFRPGSLWFGAHYSGYNRRWCINLFPMLTLWVTLPGGKTPTTR
jgi:hypothetical protein